MARHERGEGGEERAVASRAARGGGGVGGARCPAGRRERLRRGGSRAEPGRPGAGSLCGPSRAGRRAIRVLRRRLDPDSFAGADGRPQARTSSSATPRTRWISGGSIWPAPVLLSSRAREAGTSLPNDTGDLTGVASYDQGEWSVIFKRPLRPAAGASFSPGAFMPVAFSVWDGFSRERGNRRGLTPWYSLYVEPENVPSAVGPMVRTALLILVIELAVIVWVRRRYRSGAAARVDAAGHDQRYVSCVRSLFGGF